MTQDTNNPYGRKVDDALGPTSLEMVIRTRARAWIETLIEADLVAVLAAEPSTRVEGRRGYRHGTRERTLTTSLGPTTVSLPRARLRQAGWIDHRMAEPGGAALSTPDRAGR